MTRDISYETSYVPLNAGLKVQTIMHSTSQQNTTWWSDQKHQQNITWWSDQKHTRETLTIRGGAKVTKSWRRVLTRGCSGSQYYATPLPPSPRPAPSPPSLIVYSQMKAVPGLSVKSLDAEILPAVVEQPHLHSNLMLLLGSHPTFGDEFIAIAQHCANTVLVLRQLQHELLTKTVIQHCQRHMLLIQHCHRNMMYSYWYNTVTWTWCTATDTRQSLGHDVQLLTQCCHRDIMYSYWHSTVTGTWCTVIDTALPQGHDVQLLTQHWHRDMLLIQHCHRDMTYSCWHSTVTWT